MKYESILATLLDNPVGTELTLTTEHNPAKAKHALLSGLRRALKFHNQMMETLDEDTIHPSFKVAVNGKQLVLKLEESNRVPFTLETINPPKGADNHGTS